jgi:DNA polymerase III subunit gamma/tau
MAFGRKRKEREEEADSGQPPELQSGSPEEPASEAETGGADTATSDPSVPEASTDPSTGGVVGDEQADAAAQAGDPAAAGVDAEGPGADATRGYASTAEVAGPAGAPALGDSAGDASELGSAAASPDPATAPSAYAPGDGGPDPYGDGGPATGDPDAAGSPAERFEEVAEQRPEVLVAGAFAGGLVLARVLAALGGRR